MTRDPALDNCFRQVAMIACARDQIARTANDYRDGRLTAEQAVVALMTLVIWLNGSPGETFH